MTMRCNVSSWRDKNNVSSNIFQIHSHCQTQLPWNIWNFSAPPLWKYIGKYFSFYAFQRTWGWVHARTKQMETMKNMSQLSVDVWKIQAISCVCINIFASQTYDFGKENQSLELPERSGRLLRELTLASTWDRFDIWLGTNSTWLLAPRCWTKY